MKAHGLDEGGSEAAKAGLARLLEPFRSDALTTANRVVMAPLTRARAMPGTLEATDLHVEYYSQRASAGLIISEGLWVSPDAIGWAGVPGIFDERQVRSWRRVTDAVHAKGGLIVAQLWHCGSISHRSFFLGKAPLAPSAVNAEYISVTSKGRRKTSTPRAMTLDDIAAARRDFVKAARKAIEAGFDGVQIQAGYLYLFNQFLNPATNVRTDSYGGSVENRSRFLFEVLEDVADAIGAVRVGVKTGPITGEVGKFVSDDQTVATSDHVIGRLNSYPVSHLLLMGAMSDLSGTAVPMLAGEGVFARYRRIYHGTIIGNVGLDGRAAGSLIDRGLIDLAAFGQSYIANPDLVERMRAGASLNEVDWTTCYGGGAKGFTDYPRMPGS